MSQSNKIEMYKNKMLNFIKLSFPNLSEERINEKLNEIIQRDNKQKENLEIDISFFDQKSSDIKNVKLDKFETVIYKRNPIITKYGTTYMQHKTKEALEAKMLDTSGKKRKKSKKIMLEHLNDEDPVIMKKYDGIQLTLKSAIMNSYYGILTANGSIFRDLDCGESVTACGEEIIMTAIDSFERFIMNNIHFYSPSDVINYICNIIDMDYKSEVKLYISKDKLINYLSDHFYDKDTLQKLNIDLRDYESVINLINNLTDEQISKVYYKNNLFDFLNDTELYKEIEKILNDKETPFFDPNKPTDYQKDILDMIWYYLKDWVFYNYIDYNKYNFCKKGKRKAILVVDTDSNFIAMQAVYDFLKEHISIIDGSNAMKVCSVNCVTYFITHLINEAYIKFAGLHNVEDKYRSLINMKNEFMLSRLLMTKNKKSYASSVLMREGKLIENQKIDIKGMAIKKSNTNKIVGEYFANMLKNDIILSEEIKYSNVIRKYFNLVDIIKESFIKGETVFAFPKRANEIGSYENPLKEMQIRGIITWNLLFPDKEITLPTNVDLLKINIEDNNELNYNTIIDYFNKYEINYKEEDLNNFMDKLNEAINMSYGSGKNKIEKCLLMKGVLNVICLPKKTKEIPIFIRPFLNIDTMVYDHLNSSTIILDCLDIQTPKINDNLVPTNIIKI